MLRKILLGLDIICLVISIAIGIDYSCYVANIKYVNDTKTVILDDIITLNCEDKNININEENIKESYTKEFEVSNLTDKDTNFNIYLDNIVNSYDKDLVYELYNEEIWFGYALGTIDIDYVYTNSLDPTPTDLNLKVVVINYN